MNITPGLTLREAVKLLCYTPAKMSTLWEKKDKSSLESVKSRNIFDWDGDGKFEFGSVIAMRMSRKLSVYPSKMLVFFMNMLKLCVFVFLVRTPSLPAMML